MNEGQRRPSLTRMLPRGDFCVPAPLSVESATFIFMQLRDRESHLVVQQ